MKKVGSKRKNRKTGTPTKLNKETSSKTSNAASITCTSKTEILQTEQSDSPDTPDNVEELSLLVPSTRTQKMSRKLARQRQLEKMKKTEQSDERRMRYLKRQLINSGEGHNETDGEPGNKKQVHVQWCNDVTFHSYTPENTPP